MSPLACVLAFLSGVFAVAAIAAFGDWTDRSNWSSLACAQSHEEIYQYRDDRPHKQGGRNGMLTGSRTFCDERATVGPVMPLGWKPQ